MNYEKALATNPFSDDYWKAELKAYNLHSTPFCTEHLDVKWRTIQGRCDDYLNVNMRFDDTPLPMLLLHGQLWMSLTPMEIQSAALALHRAKGHVITGGLGLGYFALRAAAKPEVTKITVFEHEPLVVKWFQHAFKDRPELAKIEIVEDDMRLVFKSYEADFAYVDIYQDMLGTEVLKDAQLFRRKNKIKRYQYWDYEKTVLELLTKKMLKHPTFMIGNDLYSYFHHWMHTPYGGAGTGMLSDYSHLTLDPSFLVRARRGFTEFPL